MDVSQDGKEEKSRNKHMVCLAIVENTLREIKANREKVLTQQNKEMKAVFAY